MTMKPDARPITMIDPRSEEIRNVDLMAFHRTGTAHLDITCCALLSKSANGVTWTKEALVTARLRMDVSVAKALAEGLMRQVAMISRDRRSR